VRIGPTISLPISLEGRRGGAQAPAGSSGGPLGGRRTAPSGDDEVAPNSLADPGTWGSVWGMQRPTATAQPLAALAEDRLLRPEQAAWYLNVKTSWVYEAVRAGRLPCHRVGRHIRFTRPMLDDWLAEQPRQ
jgi:excisionase family DNA binding protein